MTWLSHIKQRLAHPTDIASLAFVRVMFGLLMFIETLRYIFAGWFNTYWIQPEFHFTYWGFGWVAPPSIIGMALIALSMATISILLMLGKFYRISAIAFFCIWTYLFLLERTRYLNHFYLIMLLSLIFCFISPHRTKIGYLPFWQLFLLRAQIMLVYVFAGIAKCTPDWLRGEPMRMWLAERENFPVLGHLFHHDWMVYGFSYSGLLLDLLVAPLLLWRRTRLPAFILLCSFHLLNVGLFSIGIFPWTMMAITTLFFAPDWPRRFFKRAAAPASAPTFPLSRITLPLIVLYLVVQCLVPLRHHLYPGPVGWTEEGHMFSWRMKLRDKTADSEFLIRDAITGAEWLDFPQDRLEYWQYRKMSYQPDLILQYAYYLQEVMAEGGYPNVEIYCTANCSLNGRPNALLIDHQVDLTAQKRSISPKSWINSSPRR